MAEIGDFSVDARRGLLQRNKFDSENPYQGSGVDPFLDSTPSNLSSDNGNSPIRSFIAGLLGRNLYSPTDRYGLESFANSDLARDQLRTLSNPTTDLVNAGVNLFRGGNYDFSNTLIGRIIGPNTPLVQIGMRQLAELTAYNVADNVRDEVVPSVNLKVNLFNPSDSEFSIESRNSYIITRPTGFLKGLISTTARLLGAQPGSAPINPFDKDDMSSENLLNNTGKGQLKSLLKNTTQNRYAFNSQYFTKKDFADISKIAFFTDARPNSLTYTSNNPENALFDFSEQEGINKLIAGGKHYRQVLAAEELGFGNQIEIDGYYNRISGNYVEGLNWGQDVERFNIQRGVLKFTQEIVNSTHPFSKVINQSTKQFETGEELGGEKVTIGRGMNNIHSSQENFNRNIFCRQWTYDDQYGTSFRTMMRNGDPSRFVNNDGSPYRLLQEEYTVLNRNGKARIHPINPNSEGAPVDAINKKRVMLSITNLAWRGSENLLPPSEIGPDGGRIMWFPPYDLAFSENSTATWSEERFIGRPEPIYTYGGSVSNGSISFTLISDYPSNLNRIRDLGDNWKFNSLMAGCFPHDIDPPAKTNALIISLYERRLEEINAEIQRNRPQSITDSTFAPASIERVLENFPQEIDYFFENNVNTIASESFESDPLSRNYNNFFELSAGTFVSDGSVLRSADNPSIVLSPASYVTWNGGTNKNVSIPNGIRRQYFGKNSSFRSNLNSILTETKEALENTQTKCIKITINGYASNLASTDYNYKLSVERAKSFETLLKNFFGSALIQPNIKVEVKAFGESQNQVNEAGILTANQSRVNLNDQIWWTSFDLNSAKEQRSVKVIFERDEVEIAKINSNSSATSLEVQNESTSRIRDLEQERSEIESKLIELRKTLENITYYFEEMKIEDNPLAQKYRERLKYFDPAFHSQTPEDLNSRLTFLRQCTKPGKPLIGSTSAGNSLFGAPPICILRVGDFYHTKIVIKNISFSYENATWDLNPEGIGIQPMLCKVTLSFDFIGGSSLEVAINDLQNALSFNYYANTHIYDDRAKINNSVSGITQVLNNPITAPIQEVSLLNS